MPLSRPIQIAVTDEKIWLQDPALAGGADNTGTAFVNTAFAAAIAKAQSAISTGHSSAVISGAPGTYKWDTSKGSLAIPNRIRWKDFGGGQYQAANFSFPTETNIPTAIGVITTGTTAGQATLAVSNIKNVYPTLGGLPVPAMLGGRNLFTYTGVTGSGTSVTLTGCAGIPLTGSGPQAVIAGPAILLAGGATRDRWGLDNTIRVIGPGTGNSSWATPTLPTNAMDGVFVGNSAGVDCSVSNFRQGIMYMGDHETFGGNTYLGGNWCNFACESPFNLQWDIVDSGNQLWETGAVNSGGVWWCHHYISPCNVLLGCDFQQQRHEGNAPWWMWKGATVGVTGAAHGMLSQATLIAPVWEGMGLGIFGGPDDGAGLSNVTITRGEANYYDGNIPAGYTKPVAAIACGFSNLIVEGNNLFDFVSSGSGGDTTVPVWLTGFAFGEIRGIDFAASLVKHPPKTPGDPNDILVDVKFPGGRVQRSGLNIQKGQLTQFWQEGNVSYPTAERVFEYGQSNVFAAPMGVTLVNESTGYVATITDRDHGFISANVRQQSTPPTSPNASTSGTAGTRSAGAHFYKIAAILSGGGETSASSEVNVTLSGSNSALLTWVAPSTIPHSQTITGYRVYHGTTTNTENGYIAVGNVLTYTDSGAATTAGTPKTTNVGCEVWGGTFVRGHSDGSTYLGKVCSVTSAETIPVNSVTIGYTPYTDDGAQVSILLR